MKMLKRFNLDPKIPSVQQYLAEQQRRDRTVNISTVSHLSVILIRQFNISIANQSKRLKKQSGSSTVTLDMFDKCRWSSDFVINGESGNEWQQVLHLLIYTQTLFECFEDLYLVSNSLKLKNETLAHST